MKHILLVAAALLLASQAALHATDASTKPNFLVILADDLGFSDLGCYGSDIATPNLDRLAANGLRFTQFYNTARCWPTRSALLTGCYPQQIHMDPPRGRLPPWTRTLPQWLKPVGYHSYHSGKWHVNGAPRPVADGGFDHSYALEDHNRNFNPTEILEDDRLLPPVAKDSGYYTTTAFADHAIRCLKEHAEKYAAQPFFSYLAFTVPHFPLQAPPEDIARYRDHYRKGWDQARTERWQNLRQMGIVNCALAPLEPAFTPRYFKPGVLETLGPGEIEHAVPWTQLTDEQKRYQATKMAIHAAMIDRMDREIGRVLAQVRAMGAWDNTVIVFLSDNGTDATIMVRGDGHDRAIAPGSAASFLCLGPGWSSAGNAPFRRHKVWTHEGGISTPLIVHWPNGIAAHNELRHDVGHVIDFVPTLLELAGTKPELAAGAPPLPGRSLVPAFAKDGSVTRDYVFFNHEGNRALRIGDYKLVSAREDNDDWELFDLATDRCEQHNLAVAQPARVRDMAARWQELQDQFTRDAGPVLPAPKKPKEADARPGFRLIETIAELRQCMATSGNKVRLRPGTYRVTDAVPDNKTVFMVTGSKNTFDLRGASIQIDTEVLAKMHGRTHELATYRVTGNGIVFEGATFEDIGDHPPQNSLSEFYVTGDDITFQDCTFIIRGSAPYGYGDLFGKGRNHKVNLQKHAALSVRGDNMRVIGCRFSIHTFGHAIHMHGAQNTFIKDVSIEGTLRLSDEILSETNGPAVKLGFKDLHNRPIGKGKMICLAEDGIRAYLDGERNGQTRRTGDITVQGCTVRRMRGGIALALASGAVTVRDCTVMESGYPGCAYSVPSKAIIRNCKGDAAYTPLLLLGYSHKHDADVELELAEARQYSGNDLVALINGSNHKVRITKPDDKPLGADLKIVCGQTYRSDEADIGKTLAKGIILDNQTRQQVLLTDVASGCKITSQGHVTNQGSDNEIIPPTKVGP